ncbi:MAG: hypothetical protein KatS3mg124_0393 [Porticoccaceae bacterium]|nr:MAG: hypothetical protein KatS3mg124_0393 [Porticoccaceae bacterium]
MTAWTAPRAVEGAAAAIPLVLIPGWGSDGRVLAPLVEALGAFLPVEILEPHWRGGLEAALENLAARLPARAHLLGWSLGGMLAVRLAARHPERVGRVVTLAANARFLAEDDWPGLDRRTFARFRADFAADPAAGQRRFCALQALGDTAEVELGRRLAALSPAPHREWLEALDWLAELDNRAELAALAQPSLHLFGAGDRLVPAEAAAALARLAPRARCALLPGRGHALPLADPAGLARRLRAFLAAPEPERPPPKAWIARAFGRAADRYDAAAVLHREVGAALLEQLPRELDPAAAVDLGCGTGQLAAALAARFPRARVLGLDLAFPMAQAAAHRHGREIAWLVGDAEALPLADASVDLAVSNLAFQWCDPRGPLSAEIRRALRPGGLLAFTTLGPDTLWQLREAWRRVDAHVHVNRFPAAAEWAEGLRRAGFDGVEVRAHTRVRHYPDFAALARELRDLGATNRNAGRPSGLTGRRRLEAVAAAYEAHREPGGLPADWQILEVWAWTERAYP